MESTLDPEDYAEIYVELHEVYMLSDDFANHVVRRRRAVSELIDRGE